MDNQAYQIQWVQEIDNDDTEIVSEEVITIDHQNEGEGPSQSYFVQEIASIPNSLDQIAAENLIYMAQDGQVTTMEGLIEHTTADDNESQNYNEPQYFECQVTEEVITDDWVQQQGEERVEIPVDQLCGSGGDGQLVEELDVPLPTDQDEYTALRPYPCDFCSRRFRKKVSLMNHMMVHQNDRPHVCNLCGARYVRRNDLLNHLKVHAHVPDDKMDDMDDSYFNDHIEARPPRHNDFYDHDDYEIKPKPKSRGRGKKMKYVKEEVQVHFSDNDNIIEDVIQDEQSVERYPITDPKKPFVCQQCGVGFAREKALLSHSRIHGSDSPYECGSCSEMFWDMNSLNEHQKSHHFEASNSEYEPENDEETDSDNDSKYGDFYCGVCGMSFHRQDLLKRHSKTHIKRDIVEGDSRHCCNVCGETFAEALDLLAHAEIHARIQPFKCMLCGENFLEEATIKKHLTNVHSSEMTKNSCRLCGKQCRDGRALMKHAWDHSREKNHSCSKCGKTFHNKARLKRHMVSHRNKSVTCDVCHEEFPDGRSLMNHRHSHTNSSGRLFPCYECGKTFGSRSSQQIHIRIHTGERPYGCRFCWKAFADGGTLRKHERIHTGEKPYACSVCPRAFNQRVVLREHIRSHHSALDSKRGTYYCPVCCEVQPSSIDLIQHLIHHSDMNTAMQRQPITGPRKYKRRRKLKPHELERLRNIKPSNSDIEYSDLDMGNVDDLLGISNSTTKNKRTNRPSNSSTTATSAPTATTSSRNRKYSGNSDKGSTSWQNKLMSTSTEDSYNAVFQNLENALNNIDSLVVSNSTSITPAVIVPKTTKQTMKKKANKLDTEKPSRPKMIHTQKTRVTAEDGKRKTKTMITRTNPMEMDDQVFQNLDRSKSGRRKRDNSTSANSDFDLILHEPTSSHDHHHQTHAMVKEEHVTPRRDLFDAQLLLEAASMRKEMDKFNPDLVNDLEEILRSPIKKSPSELSPAGSNIKTTISYKSRESPICAPPQQQEDLRRSSRIKSSTPNKKYLEFETNLRPSSSSSYKQSPNLKIKQEKPEHNIDIKREKTESSTGMHLTEKIKKEEYFQCEMCAATFADRAQLLVHVPIHI